MWRGSSSSVRKSGIDRAGPTTSATSLRCRHVEDHVVSSLWTCSSKGRLLSYGRCLRYFVRCRSSTIYPLSVSQGPSRWSRQYHQNHTTTTRGLLLIHLPPTVIDNATVGASSTDTSKLQQTFLVSSPYFMFVKSVPVNYVHCDTSLPWYRVSWGHR
jgi:hypothetical protein